MTAYETITLQAIESVMSAVNGKRKTGEPVALAAWKDYCEENDIPC